MPVLMMTAISLIIRLPARRRWSRPESVDAFCDVDLDEAHILSIRDRAIDIVHHYGEALDRNRLLRALPRRASRYGRSQDRNKYTRVCSALLCRLAPDQRVLNRHTGRGLGGVCEFQRHAGVTCRVDIRICAAEKIVDPDPRSCSKSTPATSRPSSSHIGRRGRCSTGFRRPEFRLRPRC